MTAVADIERGIIHASVVIAAPIERVYRALTDGAELVQSYALETVANGTRLTVRHEGFTGRPEMCREHTAGWDLVLGWLSAFAAIA